MSRLDFRHGRFNADYETNEINEGLRGWQTEIGDQITYYRFWAEQSQATNIWDEASAVGRVYHPPETIPVLHATHVEGGIENREEGFYFNDDLYVTALVDVLTKIGLNDLDLQTYTYLNDRIVYDYKVFKVTRINVTGQIQQRDTLVSFEGTEVRPDELLNDPQFKQFTDLKFGARR